MNDSEKRVHEYLKRRGFRSVVHEPDGKVPPDFLVDDRIAVEVRRLNQNEKTAKGHRGLEEVSKPLNVLVEKAIASIGPPVHGESWFVFYTYRRPLPPWKTLDNLLRTALREVAVSPSIGSRDVRVAGRIRLRFIRASKVHPTFIVLGGSADHDSGGFVVSAMAQNLRLCIAEKQAKIARVRTKYSEWWLVLDDRIGYGELDERDRAHLRELVQVEDPWSKIILVSQSQKRGRESFLEMDRLRYPRACDQRLPTPFSDPFFGGKLKGVGPLKFSQCDK